MNIQSDILSNEKTTQQIYNTVLILLVIALVATVFSFVKMTGATRDIVKVGENRENSNRLAFELRSSSDNLTRMARNYVVSENPEYLKQYSQVLDIRNGKSPRPLDYHHEYWQLMDIDNPVAPRGMGEAVSLTELFKQAGFTEEEFEKLDTAEQLSNKLAKAEKTAFELVKEAQESSDDTNANGLNQTVSSEDKKRMAEALLFSSEYAKNKQAIMQPIEEFTELMDARLDKQKLAAESAYDDAEKFFFISIGFAILFIIAVFLLTRQLNKLQLGKTLETQKQIEEENEKINNSIINILHSVAQLSQKDLTVRAPVTDDVVGTVSDSINFLAEETGRVMQEVKDVATLVKDSSTKVQSQAKQVTRTADEERATVEEMVQSLLQATQTMNQVAALADDTNTAGNQATQVTENALETVNDTVLGMESIRNTIAESEKRIKRLGERSQEISGIVNLINTISERTHVLALNASMQAAVAGEAGRGFAVVAEEVQRLAESSQNATKQIESLVNNIQIETNETINTVNNTIAQVVEGSEQAQKAGEQMKETQQITAKLVEQVRLIAEASDKQKQMSEQLLGSVQRMGDSAEETASQIDLQNAETDNLQSASDRLVETVSVFKLPN